MLKVDCKLALLMIFLCLSGALHAQQANLEFSELVGQVQDARALGHAQEADALSAKLFSLATQAQKTSPNTKQSVDQLAQAHFQLGRNAMERNDYPLAETELVASLNLFQKNEDTLNIARLYRQIGQIYRYQAKYSEALDLTYKALKTFEDTGDALQIGDTHNNIANILDVMGQYPSAIKAHNLALEYYQSADYKEGISSALYNIGAIFDSLNQTDLAMRYFKDALNMDIEIGEPKYIAYSHNKIGFLMAFIGQLEESRVHINEAIRLFIEIEAPRDTQWAMSSLAKLEYESGNLTLAASIIRSVIENAIEKDYKSLLVDAYRIYVEVLLAQNKIEEALVVAEKGIEQATKNGEVRDLSLLYALNMKAHQLNGSIEQAFSALQSQKQLDDTVMNERMAKNALAAQSSIAVLNKQKEVNLLEQEKALQVLINEQQQASRMQWAVVVIVFIFLLALLYRAYVQRSLNKTLTALVKQRTTELENKNTELELAYQKMEAISFVDKLTGLNNRHFLESQIEADIEQSRRKYHDFLNGKKPSPTQSDILFFIIDMDDFKKVNDKFGHSAGDLVLQQLAGRMQKVFRQSDYLIRWGGEEFVAIARSANKSDAPRLAQRMLEVINKDEFSFSNTQNRTLSCSIGYVCYPMTVLVDKNIHWHSIISLADACLYAAKYSGKNTWVGLEDIVDLELSIKNPSCKKLGDWHKQGKVVLNTSLSSDDLLKWR